MAEDHFLNLQPGTVVNGRYEIVKCLGTGSMGMVYACRHRELAGHLVAMKVLFGEVARDEVAAARFRNEIVASYGVSHPHVVRAYEYFRDGELIAFTMEYVSGGDLADRLGGDEIMESREAARMLSQMCSGVQAIHDAGIIHRDLKPENILITEQNNIKITDFGIARTGTGPKLTEHGGVVGTLDYVSPEYLEKGQVDARSDIYALGVLAYEMVAGESPFRGQSVIETMTMRLRSDPEAPSKINPKCLPELSDVILKAMARNPEERYQSAADMLYDFHALHIIGGANDPIGMSGTHGFGSVAGSGVHMEPSISRSSLGVSGSSSFAGKTGSSQVRTNDTEMIGGTVELDASSVGKLHSQVPTEEEIDPSVSASHPVNKMESVLGARSRSEGGVRMSDSPSSVSSSSHVEISHSHLSQDRVKELFQDLYEEESESVLQTLFWWLIILVVGLGVGVFVLRQFQPELFGDIEDAFRSGYVIEE